MTTTRKVTSLDVAKRAGVSRSAVSRVFTPGASVSERTASKVREAASALGYRPNVLARAMLTGKSKIIGLVVAYLDNHFYPTVLELLSEALEREGYHVLVFMAAHSTDDVEDVVSQILDYQVDGLILASVSLSSDLADRCRASGVPVVLFNRKLEAEGELAVVSDNRMGGRLAAEHLISLGRNRIGHIAGWEGASTQRDREAGFMEGLRTAGLGLFAREVGDYRLPRAKEAARRMFDTPDRPDAVFVANDYMAFGVMDVLRSELGLRVPEDVALIGFDDVPSAAWPAYGLTTVKQDAEAMVSTTVDALLSEIGGTEVLPPAPLPVTLVRRITA
ncbi:MULTISPECIES: LacI family DNA-binding transcriptional regulator [Marivita]|uniref:LacI family DNA-binding transcriptional regulator n=1 Tax=Marivita cryptomonadis TaxID=505252 RepID=A0A9Q2P6X0_9RHOB|nr:MULTISPECIES: LacI family DNA-binding transcriptional regulator [Marivita]MCR9169066.1 LacI family DNA-binding transcriptional regulator [Paracoccaceae bacterium]MBM2323367.1 LacI family DNA-binding transcriptional regulator [Marivita cryptomonadis]MBM2332953.1 LacI family DNA-binding transcriptional regulator [Marivita cryptomonadis]MBM2342534.1 LacI family DNA-binding transcriptional regulator [Marivita cryptomonadis]MBM2347201.1 LacI family DNA-binding transcriptional regulator [Marivita